MMRKFFLLFLFFFLFPSKVLAEVPVNISLSQGGAINYVGLDGENVVDTYDCGRLIQLALYDSDLPRMVASITCAPYAPPDNNSFPWNPVQACDGCTNLHLSQILSGTDASFVRVRPLLWLGEGKAGDFVIEQRISQTQFSNAVKVNYKIIHEGDDSHKNFSLELPATWILNKYSKFVYYNGLNPWSNGSLKETTSNADYNTEPWLGTESWGALVNPLNNRGIGIYNPSSILAMNFSSDPHRGKTNKPVHFTTWISMEFSPKSEFSYDIYILTGSVEEIRSTVYKLPRNTNYIVEPVGNIPTVARKGETLNVSVKITNKTLVPFHKDDNKPNYDKTIVRVKDGSSIEDWNAIVFDVNPGQSITMTLPVRVSGQPGKYKYTFDVLNRWWLAQSGFPPYSFTLDVIDNLPTPTPVPTFTPTPSPRPTFTLSPTPYATSQFKYLGKGWNRVVVDVGNVSQCLNVIFRGSKYFRCALDSTWHM